MPGEQRRLHPRIAAVPCLITAVLISAFVAAAPPAGAASLRPSRSALLRQIHAAQEHGFDYVRSSREIPPLVARGLLVRVEGNADYEIKEGNRYPYARPEVEDFLERLAKTYRQVCREKLVVTSLLRPKNDQPRNASSMSVHPTGMAMDLRRSWSRGCRAWIESALTHLEDQGVVEAAREIHPPHYHVVLFPMEFRTYVTGLPPGAGLSDAEPGTYRVRRGDTLWKIAHRHDTTVESLRRANGLSSTTLRIGQVLELPGE
jgi:hypothetical protein